MVKAEVRGTDRIIAALKKKLLEKHSSSCVIGYTSKYALWVHENRAMKWRGYPRDRSVRRDDSGGTVLARTGFAPGKGKGLYWGPKGRAGFLLDVMREMANTLRQIVVTASQKGVPLGKALLLAGLRLQRESQLNVPVDTGNLKSSAFTRLEL